MLRAKRERKEKLARRSNEGTIVGKKENPRRKRGNGKPWTQRWGEEERRGVEGVCSKAHVDAAARIVQRHG